MGHRRVRLFPVPPPVILTLGIQFPRSAPPPPAPPTRNFPWPWNPESCYGTLSKASLAADPPQGTQIERFCHTPLDRALAAARARFSLFDKMCLWHPFGSHFGGVLGAQMEAKAIKKPLQKNIKKMMPKMTPNWSQRGSQNGAKIIKNEVLEAPCFKGGSQVASRDPPGSILERFWDHFGTIVGSFLSYF